MTNTKMKDEIRIVNPTISKLCFLNGYSKQSMSFQKKSIIVRPCYRLILIARSVFLAVIHSPPSILDKLAWYVV